MDTGNMAWEPQEEPLRHLVHYLRDSLNGLDPAAQKNAELMLKQAKSSPDIDNYLVYLVSRPNVPPFIDMTSDQYHMARSAAALMLKNHIKTSYNTISDRNKSYIRSVILLALQDSNPQIRNYAGNVITEIVRQGGILGWPQILTELLSLASGDNVGVPPEAQEGATSALFKICEDNKRALDKQYQGQRPLNFVVPKLLDLTSSRNPKVRANALASINIFIPDKPQALLVNMDAVLLRLFELANDPSGVVRKHVCRSFIQIAEVTPGKLAPHMGGLVDFIVTQQRSLDDSELALEAAEFWICVGEAKTLVHTLGPYLPKIIPVLLESMVYSEDDIMRLESENEDAEGEDRDQDIKPQFATLKGARITVGSNGDTASPDPAISLNGSGKTMTASFEGDDLSEGEIDEHDDDEDNGVDPEEQWNLRKCSAAALDVLASAFHRPVFEITLPYLKDNLNHPEWPNREAAVLAIGAIAEGCMDVVEPHLPELTPFLLSLLQDREPIVRQITCWSLGRYSHWAAHLDAAGKERYFVPVMEGILGRMLDSNKRVQEAAASAFATLEEKANKQLRDYCPGIVAQFAKCFYAYKDRNMFILYDCFQTLAEHVGPTLAKPELVNVLMPALLQRWKQVKDQSREMFPLFECLSYVATALGRSFAPFAAPVFERCIRIIRSNLEDLHAAATNDAIDRPDKDFLVTSLDLLSAIIQAVDSSTSNDLVANSQPSLFDMLAFCMKDSNADVRQSAYALLGDCAIHVFPQLQPALDLLLPLLISELDISQLHASADDTIYAVINNACWSCGEIAARHREGMTPYVNSVLERLGTILFSNTVPESLNENAAIALGRLGIGCSQAIAPHLGSFAPPFLQSISHVRWTDEKGHAMKGFTEIVLRNPQAMEQCLMQYFIEIAAAPDSSSLKDEGPFELYKKALLLYKDLIPDFDAFLHHLPPEKEHALRSMYQV